MRIRTRTKRAILLRKGRLDMSDSSRESDPDAAFMAGWAPLSGEYAGS
jgi:hypothetical protein